MEKKTTMKKAFTILMLTLSLATFSQNVTKVVVLDTYNKGGKVRQSILTEVKTDFAQVISDMRGFEGIINDKIDHLLLAEGFADHPRLSEEQAEWVANLSGTQYALMSSASIELLGDLSIQIILIDLDAYQVMASESIDINNNLEDIHMGCIALVKKIIDYLPEPQGFVVEDETEQSDPLTTTKPSTQRGNTKYSSSYAMPLEPQQLTRLEADQVSYHLNRADVCIEMNYIDNAIQEYNEIVKIAPGWANVYMYLGNTYTMKGDKTSLKIAKECYDIFMQLTDDQTLYYEAQDKLSRVEMMTELKAKEVEKKENLVGTWSTNRYDPYTGKPFFVVEIAETPNSRKYQVKLSPKSYLYNNITNKTAYTEIVDNEIAWSFVWQYTYIPSQTKYNAQGAAVNILAGDNIVASAIGNVLVEAARESDVGYTNIYEYSFLANANVGERRFMGIFDDGQEHDYLKGSMQIKGEHHKSGLNQVVFDSVYDCDLLRGDEKYPVLLKIEKLGNNYKYGDMIVKNDAVELANVLRMGGYVDTELDGIKKVNFAEGLGLGLGIVGVPMTLIGLGIGVASTSQKEMENAVVLTSGGLITFGVGAAFFVIGLAHEKNCYKKLISIHNQRVDQKTRTLKTKRDVGLAIMPCGVGLQLNF